MMPAMVRASRVIGSSTQIITTETPSHEDKARKMFSVSQWSVANASCKLSVGCHFPTVRQDVRVYTQSVRQLRTGIEFDQGFENLGVDFFRRLVGAHVFRAQLLPNSDYVSPEFLLAVSISRNV